MKKSSVVRRILTACICVAAGPFHAEAQSEWETTSKLRYAPPTVVAPTTITAPVSGTTVLLASDEDAIVFGGTTTLTGNLEVDGGRNIRVIGGDLGRNSLYIGHESVPSSYKWGPSRSAFIEGVKIDKAAGFPVVNGELVEPDGTPEADAIHVTGAPPYTSLPPDIYVQNCHIANPCGTTYAHGSKIPVSSVTCNSGTLFTIVTASPHGLVTSGSKPFICGPTTEPLLNRSYQVKRILSSTQIEATIYRPFTLAAMPPLTPGLTGTGGYIWVIDTTRSGVHSDCYQAAASSVLNVNYYYKVTMTVGGNGHIGGHTLTDTEARGLVMTRVNARPNIVWPHDDSIAHVGFADSYYGGPTTNLRLGVMPVAFDRVYLKPRLGMVFTDCAAPPTGKTRNGVPVGMYTQDNGLTGRWPLAVGATGFVAQAFDGYGENGKDYADLSGTNAPGANYVSPGYSSDAIAPLTISAITVNPAAPSLRSAAAAGVVAGRLDVTFTGSTGHIIDLSLLDNAGGRFALSGRNIVRNGTTSLSGGPFNVTVRAVDRATGLVSLNRTIPITINSGNTPPVVTGTSITLYKNVLTLFTLSGTDADRDILTFSRSIPAHGTLTGSGTNLRYTPDTNFTGTDSITFTASDGTATSNTGTVTFVVLPIPTPRAFSQSVKVKKNTATPITLAGTTGLAGDTLTYSITSGPSHGTVTGATANVTYTPAANFKGTDSFTFSLNGSPSATVSITVVPAATGTSITTNQNTAAPIALSGDGPAFTMAVKPLHGTITGTGANVTYTPAANYHGHDSFMFTTFDGTSTSFPEVVKITINDTTTPTAATKYVGTSQNGPVVIALSGSDAGNEPLTFVITGTPAHGSLSSINYNTLIGKSPTVTYTPAANYTGGDSFTYKASDGTNTSAAGTVNINVATALSPTITTADPLPGGKVNFAYSTTLTASGGFTPYTWTLDSGALPPGYSLSSSGVISGTCTSPLTRTFTIRVTGGDGVMSSTKQFTLAVAAPPTITTESPLPNGTVGVAYSTRFFRSGGASSPVWTVINGTLPPGLSLAASSGILSGTPTAAGAYNFTVRCTASDGQFADKVFDLTVN